MVIKKKDALRVVGKFGMDRREGKERIAILYCSTDNRRILSTAIPKGHGDMNCTDSFRKDLRLSQDELRKAIRGSGSFDKGKWLAKLKTISDLIS